MERWAKRGGGGDERRWSEKKDPMDSKEIRCRSIEKGEVSGLKSVSICNGKLIGAIIVAYR